MGSKMAKLGSKMAELGSKMTKLGSKMAKMGSKMAKFGFKMAMFGCKVAELGNYQKCLGLDLTSVEPSISSVSLKKGEFFLAPILTNYQPNIVDSHFELTGCIITSTYEKIKQFSK